ncbi:MAG: amino acid permease [Thermoguttaceae bacterium]|jgi:amino acid transporter
MARTTVEDSASSAAAPRRQLTLLDSTSIIVGIIIGSGIYRSSPLIAGSVPNTAWLIGVWILGGLLSLVGALCYAELANAYPREGGDYVYLTRALGRKMGFLFAWSQLWIVRPGSIGLLAYVFASYANQLRPVGNGPPALMAYAVLAVLLLTAINLLGLREGKWTQNLLTVIKILGLAAIVVVGLCAASPAAAPAATMRQPDYRTAMIFVLFTYGGWNEMAYVGAEVRDPAKNILRALVLGTTAVTVIYVLVNLAFVHALGFAGVGRSQAVAADVLRTALGPWGAKAISVLICISALGAINGMIFTGARIYFAMGSDHRRFAWLAAWNARRDTPVRSMLVQAAIVLALVVGFGWSKDGFETLTYFTTPVFWIMFLLVGASLFVLRYREPHAPRPYRVPLYPLTPAIFCLSSLFMVYASMSWAIDNKSYEALWSIGLLAVGLALSFVNGEQARQGSVNQ